MRWLPRSILVLALAWLAFLAARGAIRRSAAGTAVDLHRRLFASTEQRLRAVLGDQAEVVAALRAAAPAGTLLLNQKVMGRLEDYAPHELLQLAAKNGLIEQLTTLCFPEPWLFSVPEPIPSVEREVDRGIPVALFVLAGDPTPTGRAGWRLGHDAPQFQIWLFEGGR